MSKKYFTCPMHPQVREDRPGSCPLCGMALELAPSNKKPSHMPAHKTSNSYTPLIVVVSIISLVTLSIGLREYMTGIATVKSIISTFMIGFFITFAGFKLIDLSGFVEGYKTYDLIARRVPWYGYAYPFIELAFGVGMIVYGDIMAILIAEILIMTVSGIGVAMKIARKERFQCACLGTVLKVPLTSVTLIEDFGMAALALILLLM